MVRSPERPHRERVREYLSAVLGSNERRAGDYIIRVETALDDQATRDVPMERLYVARALIAGHILRESGECFFRLIHLQIGGGLAIVSPGSQNIESLGDLCFLPWCACNLAAQHDVASFSRLELQHSAA